VSRGGVVQRRQAELEYAATNTAPRLATRLDGMLLGSKLSREQQAAFRELAECIWQDGYLRGAVAGSRVSPLKR
jgi:hypothetical protein